MTCFVPKILYANPPFRGAASANSRGDGYGIELIWVQAWSGNVGFTLAYNIYFSTRKEDVFTEGVKYVVTDGTLTRAGIDGLTPGDVYYFAVRATLHDSFYINLNNLPSFDAVKLYPEAMLLADITDDDLNIPVSDVGTFPATGIVQIGSELIAYTSRDLADGYLVLPDVSLRGLYGTEPRLHTIDGYDGYSIKDPLVKFFRGFEDGNISVVLEENKFEHKFARTNEDGYRMQTDLVTTDLSSSEADQIDFPAFDFGGYRRIDPATLLSGECVGSYYGGEHYCADGYNGVGVRVRGLSIEDVNNQREEVLLETTGEEVVLVRRMWEGITCSCVSSTRETPEHRCSICLGTSFVQGYTQFYNPRRSSGRILVRFDPSVEDLIPQVAGLESMYKPNAWALSVPIIKDRDFLIRFNKDGTEEFRYEVLDVTRNKILLDNVGAQKMTLNRIRKTDPIYMFRAFRNTATMPTTLSTTIGIVAGPGGIPPHVHEIVINENIVSISQINQVTGVSQGHSHTILNGIVQEAVGHNHQIILP